MGEGLSDVGNDPSPYGSMKRDQQALTHGLRCAIKGNLLAREGRNLCLLPFNCFLHREGGEASGATQFPRRYTYKRPARRFLTCSAIPMLEEVSKLIFSLSREYYVLA